MSEVTASFLQFAGSPFTDAQGKGIPKVPDAYGAPTVDRYVRIQSTIQCDSSGAFELLVPSNPYAAPFPVLQSDLPPDNITTTPVISWTAGTATTYANMALPQASQYPSTASLRGLCTGLAQTYKNYQGKLANIYTQLYNNPPPEHRLVFGGVRVWSLQGTDAQQGIIRGAPIDTQCLLQYLQGMPGGNQSTKVINLYGGASLTPQASVAGYVSRLNTGVFTSQTVPGVPVPLTGCYPYDPQNTTSPAAWTNSTWQQYMKNVGSSCEYPSEYEIFPGQEGCSVRFQPNTMNLPMEQFSPRSIVFPQTAIVGASVSSLTNPKILCISDVMGTVDNTSGAAAVDGITLQPQQDSRPFPNTAVGGYWKKTPVALTLPCAGILTNCDLSVSPDAAYIVAQDLGTGISKGVVQTSTTVVSGTTQAAVYLSALNTVDDSPDNNADTTQIMTIRRAVDGVSEDTLVQGDVAWTSARISGSAFAPNSILWVEYVWCFEETLWDESSIMAQPSPVDPNFPVAFGALCDRNAFPIVVKGHSFFDSLKNALKKVGGWIETAGSVAAKAAPLIALL